LLESELKPTLLPLAPNKNASLPPLPESNPVEPEPPSSTRLVSGRNGLKPDLAQISSLALKFWGFDCLLTFTNLGLERPPLADDDRELKFGSWLLNWVEFENPEFKLPKFDGFMLVSCFDWGFF
jgi:hypothetical protein